MQQVKFIEEFHPAREAVLGDAGSVIGDDWKVFNASRPLPGTVTWASPDNSRVGWFYAAIDPQDEYAAKYEQRCRELDGYECVWVTSDQVMAWARAYYSLEIYTGRVKLSEFDMETIARSYLRHSDKERDE